MRFLVITLALRCAALAQSTAAASDYLPPHPDAVNAVIGDESFERHFGRSPNESDDPIARIQTHLDYVIDSLRANPAPELSAPAREQREALLDALTVYARAGIFPQNDVRAPRAPRFIDPDGRLCAVGFLIAHSVGLGVAESINQDHEWSYIAEIDDPRLDAWVDAHGFTRHELGMIQPSYHFRPPVRPRPTPAPTNASLHRLLSAQQAAVQQCASQTAELTGTTVVAVRLTFHPRAGIVADVRRAAGPSPQRFELCVQQHIVQAARTQWPTPQSIRRPISASIRYRVRPASVQPPRPPAEPRRVIDQALSAAAPQLHACVQNGFVQGQVTTHVEHLALTITAAGGRLQLVGVRLPPGHTGRELTCLSQVVSGLQVPRDTYVNQLQTTVRLRHVIRHPLRH